MNVAIYELLSTGEYLELFDPIFTFRASYAGDREHRHLLKDGDRQRLSFTGERLTSRRLQAGSRLIVVLGLSKRPDMQINYGGGDDVSIESMADQTSPLQIRWYNDSYIDVPVQQ